MTRLAWGWRRVLLQTKRQWAGRRILVAGVVLTTLLVSFAGASPGRGAAPWLTVVYGDQLEAPILIRGWHENDAFRLSLGPPFQPDHETLLERPPPRRSWWRVESRTRRQTVLVWGQRPNHVLHLLMTVFTLGLWGVVWILIAMFGGEKRRTIRRSDYS